jgi:site-specific recombinase XerD
VSVLRTWMKERGGHPQDPLFPTSRGTPLSRDAVAALVAKHTATAACHHKPLVDKKVTPHVLRHTCAMRLLRGGVDRAVLALWLGHEQVQTTDIYTHADLTVKQQALARTTPPNVRPGRYRPPDRLLAFLQQL